MTSIDGFDPAQTAAFAGFDASVSASTLDTIERVGRRLHVSVEGIERLPTGRALLVSNHTFGWDIAFAVAAIRSGTGRTVWSLGEHAWWRFPWVRRLASQVGVVDGTAVHGREHDSERAREPLLGQSEPRANLSDAGGKRVDRRAGHVGVYIKSRRPSGAGATLSRWKPPRGLPLVVVRRSLLGLTRLRRCRRSTSGVMVRGAHAPPAPAQAAASRSAVTKASR